MKEHPILFTGSMVRAILEGRKTQTRRAVKSPAKNMQQRGIECIQHREPGDSWYGNYVWSMRNHNGAWCDFTQEKFMTKCRYGNPCDRLWVRESFQLNHPDETFCLKTKGNQAVWYHADHVRPGFTGWVDGGGWSRHYPSIHMPRWASRLNLEVTGVRVERLQAISESDARAEGISVLPLQDAQDTSAWWQSAPGVHQARTATESFHLLWDSINAKHGFGWDENPWVWVVEFKRLD